MPVFIKTKKRNGHERPFFQGFEKKAKETTVSEEEKTSGARVPEAAKKIIDKVRQRYVRQYGSIPAANNKPASELASAIKRKKEEYQGFLR